MDDRTRFSAIIAVAAGAGILLSVLIGLLEITVFGVLSGIVSAFILAYFLVGAMETVEGTNS